MQLPTNYKAGTGLAAAIMGGQAGLEQEKMGLENVVKGMSLPAEQLKMREAEMLNQDPNYLQQKTANTLIELGNQYDAGQFQQTLNAANRIRIQLDAASGDPAKEQQIVSQAIQALKMDPNSPFAQYAMRDPRGALDKFIQGTEAAMSRSAKQIGEEKLQGIKDIAAMDRENVKGKFDLQKANISASAQRDAANRYERGDLIKYSGQLTSEIQNYNTNIAKLEGKEMDAAIVADFVKRNGKEPTPDQITESKQSFKKQLEQERDALIEQRDSVRGMVGGKLGMKPQGDGTAGNPIKLD